MTKEEAEASCEKIGTGWRLCTAAEWLDACNGARQHRPSLTATPTAAQRCNGWDYIQGGRRHDGGDRRGDDVRLRAVDDDDRRRALRHERQREGVGADRRPRPRGRSRCAAAPTTPPASRSARRPARPACSATRPFPLPRPPCVCRRSGSVAAARGCCLHEKDSRDEQEPGVGAGSLARRRARRDRRAGAVAAAQHHGRCSIPRARCSTTRTTTARRSATTTRHGQTSRVFNMKNAIRAALAQVGNRRGELRPGALPADRERGDDQLPGRALEQRHDEQLLHQHDLHGRRRQCRLQDDHAQLVGARDDLRHMVRQRRRPGGRGPA